MAIIRVCSASDLEKLQAFSESTFRATFEMQNDPAALNAYIDKALNSNQLKHELGLTGSKFYFLEDEGDLIGFLKLNLPPNQSDINDPKSLEIERIYIDHQYQGKGHGKQLFNFALAEASKYGCEYIWLGVWERNFKAIDFYYSNGFIKFDQHPFKLGSEDQLDYLLKLDLT
jgi:ribosomal protein S18 acetylase RimI-like enzyme